ncbi:unnamed protein product [Ceratitis capitata]|uniref:(Mediterranean fruit fly) hypothetical protein n=1 Tax=Ceratitis capitata TaxID=7213 RepID=A0A811VJ86_CERCA|nr:unnamed protein product [Ceratitis capitata]
MPKTMQQNLKNIHSSSGKKIWQLTPNDTRYDYYAGFLQVLNLLRYDTLDTLHPYQNDTTLGHINYVDVLTKLQRPEGQELQLSKSNQYAPAMTEIGLCRTSSQLNKYTNPSGKLKSIDVGPVQYCLFMSICITKLYPEYPDNAQVSVYLHNPFDVVSPGHITNVYLTASPGRVLTVDLEISTFSAEVEVRNLPVEYRKCRYPDESNLKFFQTYTTALCCMDQRIRRALELCKCKPHFYAVAPELPVCSVDQLLCLHKHNWTKTNCTGCVQLCEYMFYVQLQQSLSPPMQQEGFLSQKFERIVVIQLQLPYRGIRRRVVFSSDQLIVSFGGAVSLFLGASFMTFYTMIKIFGEFVALNFIQFWRKRRQQKQKQQQQQQPNRRNLMRVQKI